MGTYHSYHNGTRPIANIWLENTFFSQEKQEWVTKSLMVRALFDTGATVTCISNAIIQELRLKVVTKGRFRSASGEETETYVYDAKIIFPLTLNYISEKNTDVVSIAPTEVVPIQIPVMAAPIEQQEIDLLIGMDLISRGNFYINKNFLSFEIPFPDPLNMPYALPKPVRKSTETNLKEEKAIISE